MIEPIPQGQNLVELRHYIDALELEFSRRAYRFSEGTQWDDEGFNTPLDWLRINCHMTSTAASDRLAVGERLPELQHSIRSMDAGEIGLPAGGPHAKRGECVADGERDPGRLRRIEAA